VSEAKRFERLRDLSPPPVCNGFILLGCETWGGTVARCEVGRCEVEWTAQ
jgi:hypothetical protein